ncbi:MAG: amylo-alpha-1,6-glucosidase [Ktedonobacterales bacterium]|nr:amylo-alpha-1,6-glucosidase [Ktedonobacterales bacterium]
MTDRTDDVTALVDDIITPSVNEQADQYAVQQVAKMAMRTVALKRDNTFLVADVRGDLLAAQQEMGLYWHDTRYLRTLDLLLEGEPLISLAHSIDDDGDACQIDLCNPFLQFPDGLTLGQGAIHIRRWLELHDQRLVEHLSLTSYHQHDLTVRLGVQANADFRDIFEVRGMHRSQRGKMLPTQMQRDALTLRYRGLDDITRSSHVAFSPPADEVGQAGIYWNVILTPQQATQIRITVDLQETTTDDVTLPPPELHEEPALVVPEITTSNVFFNRLLARSLADLTMMSARTPEGIFPYAGLPWYVCPFGRDALLTSLEFLPWQPQVARGTLLTLAKYQGTKVDEFTEEEPGKILHEFRRGEMAHCREVPFIPYYGTIDATPLFIILLEAYIRWTNDLAFLRELWPHAKAAAEWMLQYGDRDGDGFLEYVRNVDSGLINQGWKDSWDAVSYANGELAEAPIALCEVQGYAYAAYQGMRVLAERLGHKKEAVRWHEHAEELRARFWKAFWWESEQILYLALDGNKRPCQVVSSNAGQCLWTGIVPTEAAGGIVARLMRDDMYSEWGIRTLSSHAARYNPMSYHNGSVWPHDTALIGAGFARYGFHREAGKLLEDLFTLSLHYERARLPELLCGFARRQGYGPTPYPVACSPQAWAAGAPFMLLSALLGLQPHADQGQLTAFHPSLPPFLQEIETMTLMLGDHPIELAAARGKRGNVTLTHQGNADLHVVAGA